MQGSQASRHGHAAVSFGQLVPVEGAKPAKTTKPARTDPGILEVENALKAMRAGHTIKATELLYGGLRSYTQYHEVDIPWNT